MILLLIELHLKPIVLVVPCTVSEVLLTKLLLLQPERVTTLLSPAGLCGPDAAPPYLLVIICSAVQNFEARAAIRSSWAQDQNTLHNVKIVFLVGQLVNNTHQVCREKFCGILSFAFFSPILSYLAR